MPLVAATILIANLQQITHAKAEPSSIAAVVAKVSSSVVGIVVVRPLAEEEDKPGPKVASAAGSDHPMTALGSGFVIDPSGYIATNKHVIDRAVSIFVTTADGVRYQAKIVGMPDKVDMALLHIDAGRPLPAVPFGDSDNMHVGDMVIAIGSPFGFDNSVTAGIISAVNRDIMESPFDEYFQTDAAINHGNSGGPLFNLAGEVIGMNSVIFAPGTGSVGIGFAIPSNELHFVFDRLIKTGEVRAGMLPIYTQPVSWMLKQAMDAPGLEGALVSAVNDNDDKMLHGKIRPGDIVLSFNGQKIWDPRDLQRKAARAPIGSNADLEIDRGGARQTVQVTIHAWSEVKQIMPSSNAPQKLGLTLISGQSPSGQPVVTVDAVEPNGTAADSGIQKGDIVLEVQRIPVSEPDQALHLFSMQSSTNHSFAAVLIERDKKRSWMPVAVPPQ